MAYTFTWSGYTSQYSPSRTPSNGRQVATSANRTDTAEVAMGSMAGSLDAAAETSFDWGAWNETGVGERKRFFRLDGDVVISPATFSAGYCGTSTTPSNMKDIRGLTAHELGHTQGLGHKLTTQTTRDIMYGYAYNGAWPSTLSEADKRSLRWLYD